ncbi:phage terminase large subunit [Paenibacillus sp. HWE-109]|uniref:phage terminase large subunit n=1 Tax=Paenibacillus sp. HWE-109 TaxID=1306526 RepID=UPI001EE08850|nr:phage terminase large subunit [Paenibacillus sp. HWE-109]UKS30168.1 phage terminase large subunit [Paenibacillus sp. HWE-109]
MVAQPSLTAAELTEFDEFLTEKERLERINRAEDDLLYFAYEYFGEVYNVDNSGNWIPVPIEEAPAFHAEICDIMNVVSTKEVNAKVAVAAPRSHAKSSFLSKAFPIHELVFRKRKYVIIISETPQVSTGNMEWLSLQLKSNEKLRADFGPLLSVKQQENPKDNSSEFIAWEPRKDGSQRLLCRVEAASTGQALRGRNWNGTRPDLIICDDLEGKKNTNTDQLRTEMRDWFTQVVIPLGDPAGKKTAFVYMGTMVHHDSLLRYVMEKRSDFKTKLFRAVIEWPERMDLWEACRLVYNDRDNPKRAEEAEALYEMNRAEMERGSTVLWPDVQPLWKLFRWKWDNGSKAFNTEYMNNPVDEENMVFNPEKFTYYDGLRDEFPVAEFDVFMGVDFAMGKTRGDYSAIVAVAKHRSTGAIFVIDAWGERVHPDVFLRVIVDKVIRYQPSGIAAEAQAAQEFFVHKLKEALRMAGYPANSRVKEIHQRARKELRIEAMAPDIENGTLRFTRKHALLLEQFELYGSGTHDDLPDAMEMAVSIAKNGRKRVTDKPAWL